ncbi:MAG: polymer-forming cytoskeletal protein [Acidobacteriota bacterium]
MIGRRTLIRGIVKGDGPVVIHGALEGELTLGGALSISPTSRVDAEIEARSVEISGETRGTLAAAGRVILEAGGVFDGELTTPVLEVRPGSVLRGRARVSGLQTLARRRVSH